MAYFYVTMLNKNVAGILAIILGGFGVHRFYLGQRFLGVVRFLARPLYRVLGVDYAKSVLVVAQREQSSKNETSKSSDSSAEV